MVSGRLPGTVIGQVFRTGTSTPREFPRYTGIIAKGLDLKLFRDASLVRSAVSGETLPFSGVTYTAPLARTAIPDKTRARLYTSDGRSVPPTRWNFTETSPGSNVFDQVSIDPSIFSTTLSYQIDYISNDTTILDIVPVDELREVIAVGDNQGQVRYREGVDFRFTTTNTGPLPGSGNLNPSGSTTIPAPGGTVTGYPTNTGTGIVKIDVSSSYAHDYNRSYVLECTASAGVTPNRTADFRLDCYPTSSGADALPGLSTAQANSITFQIDEATPASLTVNTELGIVLDFTGAGAPDFGFGLSNFVPTDKFAYSGVGPGLLELDDKLLNTNQFAEVSAVATVVENGEGAIVLNPQSTYTGTVNQPYEIECTATPVPTGASRSATFRWRTTPKLKTITGTVTATNLSTAVTGSGTSFNTEVAAGDLIVIGDSPAPVQVASVTDAGNLVLVDPFPFANVSGRALRIRESTGSFTVAADGTGITNPVRKLIDQGIYLDFTFGPTVNDNFDVGDKYSLTAKVARQDYNGKENRNYDLTVTSVATPHLATVSYVGSTAAATFGSHTFAEGSPLSLPNNVVVYARNLTLDNRLNTIPQSDTFELSLTFDGLIDWTLQTEAVETISTSSVLRDLTGSVTGTPGAYFVLLRKIPESISYVSGPSPTFANIPYSHVAGTTVVYFMTNPGVALTIKYRHAGIEPSPGSTYFMTGYIKRPASDFDAPQLFTTRDQARDFLAPMTVTNDAAIANEIAWDQDELSLPGVVVLLVKDSDGDGVIVPSDYDAAIRVSEQFRGTTDFVVVNQFGAREEFRDSIVNMNDPTIARRRVGYFGFPVGFPIGDEFTSNSRVYVARRELQVFEETVARGSLAIIGNSFGKKTVRVDSLGDGSIDAIPTQVTLDGSFLAVGLAARVSSFNEPWQTIYGLPLSGFDEIEVLTETQMITLQDAGIICCRVENGSAFYVGTMTTDSTEPSTQQLSGTVQRQYVLNRLQDVVNRRVIGFVADSPEQAAQKVQGELVAEIGAMVSEGKIARYVDETTGLVRAMNPNTDVVAFRDRRDPTRAYFRASWYQKYPLLYVDGIVAVDAPTP